MKQIALPLALDRQYSFDNFFAPDRDLYVANLRALIDAGGETQIGLRGGPGRGKTHLLNACAHYARGRGVRLQLFDARQLLDYDASLFEGFDQCDVLAIDNLDAVAGRSDWETCFYQVINACREGHYRLVFSLAQKPEDLPACLDDFRSRLQWGLMLELPVFDDAQIRDVLVRRARLLGVELSSEAVSYLLTRYPRNLSDLMTLLRRLDGASLSHQRRVTIPLIKQTLAGD